MPLPVPVLLGPVLAPEALAPLAEALLRLERARAAVQQAEADLIRLRGLPQSARLREFGRGAAIDRMAWQADLDRLAPFAEDHARLARLTEAEKAVLFPVAGGGHDEAAYQATLARYARHAADYAALKDAPEGRLEQLYPAAPSLGGYRRALAGAEARLARARDSLAQAEAQADAMRLALVGDRPLTPAEQDYLTGYLGG